MKIFGILLLGGVLAPHGLTTAAAAEKRRSLEEVEPAVRLQVFLDRAEFGPGKIDGHYGEFTQRALALYRQAKNLPPLPEPAKDEKKGAAPKEPPLPEFKDMNLSGLGEAFIQYAVTEADAEGVGELPEAIAAQAKLKWLPYRTLAEAVAEKFHCDQDFLAEINPSLDLKQLKAGDEVTVPNVRPFILEKAKEKADEEAEKQGNNDVEDREDPKKKEAEPVKVSIKVDTSTNMLQFFDEDRLTAAFPVTIGSSETETPIGEWKVRRAYHLPHFRYDKEMLTKGQRSKDFHILKPGPNNLVGVVWIALNKKGIGIHGTAEPDSIGRSASHGCIRLANWDAVRLAARVQPGMAVSIH